MDNMREYWAREAEKMRDKSGVLDTKEQVLVRPNYETNDNNESPVIVERANVLMVQVTKDGAADSPLQNQYDKLKNDLYDNKEWDILYCQNIHDAADKLSKRNPIDNLVYLHHGSDWGYNPRKALAGRDVKELIAKRNQFLVDRILKEPNNTLDELSAKISLNKQLLNADYKEKFIDAQKSKNKEDVEWRNLILSLSGVEDLFKNINPNGTFVDASCYQGSSYGIDTHTVFDSLRMLSFEKINIYTNTNATIIETNSDMMSQSISGSQNFHEEIGTIMNDRLTSKFNDTRGWIYFDSTTRNTVVTNRDIMLNAYKKPIIQRVDKDFVTPRMRTERKFWFSKKFRDWRRNDVEKWLKKTYQVKTVSKDRITEYFDKYTKETKDNAKL
jgi:hypothetical protein